MDATELATGRELKQIGLDLVESNNKGAIDRLRRYAKVYAECHGTVTIDAVRRWAEFAGVQVKHSNTYGAIFRGRGWRKVGYQPSTTPSAHARTVAIWALATGGP